MLGHGDVATDRIPTCRADGDRPITPTSTPGFRLARLTRRCVVAKQPDLACRASHHGGNARPVTAQPVGVPAPKRKCPRHKLPVVSAADHQEMGVKVQHLRQPHIAGVAHIGVRARVPLHSQQACRLPALTLVGCALGWLHLLTIISDRARQYSLRHIADLRPLQLRSARRILWPARCQPDTLYPVNTALNS